MRDSAKQNRGKPPIKKMQETQGGLPRSLALARNDDFLDSAFFYISQNLGAESAKIHAQFRKISQF